jgi:hypothetical protein
MTEWMIWTFVALGWIALMTFLGKLGSGRVRRYSGRPFEGKSSADLTGLHKDMQEVKERLASIEQVLRQVE